jgi:hypothetical protein
MAKSRNEIHFLWFDPGQTATGWAFFSVHRRAFTNHRAKILTNILFWRTGEFTGTEHSQLEQAKQLMYWVRFNPMPFVCPSYIGTEQFDLTQIIGGRELLSPVRINAVLDWECARTTGLTLEYQARSMRTNVTRARLKEWGLHGVKGKDAFAATQHAIVRMRRLKVETNKKPLELKEE